MKKVFFLALGLTLFVSCSNDSEGNQPEINTVNFQTKATTLQTTYDQMLSSDSWIKYDKALGVFLEKMNCDDSSAFDTPTTMYNWISSNIGSTGFASLQDAANDLDEVSNLGNVAYENNLSFYDAVGNSTTEELYDVVYDPAPQQPDSCKDECKTTFNGCVSSVSQTYAAESIMSVRLIKDGKTSEGNAQRNGSIARFKNGLNSCKNSFNNCVKNCDK